MTLTDLEDAKMMTTNGDSSDEIKSVSERILDLAGSEPSEADKLFIASREMPISEEEISALSEFRSCRKNQQEIRPFIAVKDAADRKGRQKSVVFVGITGSF